MMKKLLYIGHSYHNKTKSTAFLKELFETIYEVETLDFDPYDNTSFDFKKLKNRVYDVVVIFQMMPDIKKIKSYIKASSYVFFPMYDASGEADITFWYKYKDVKIINFSKTLHQKLLAMGLDTHYIQYFPKPMEKGVKGSPKSIYFWQRVTKINTHLVERLFLNIGYDKIHIHRALDPLHTFTMPSKKMQKKATYSEWTSDKDKIRQDILKASIYIAPRVYEGIGMSFLEAMAMGRCVIAPDLPTMNEYIKNGVTGILYDINNIEPLKNFDAVRIGKNARRFIKKGFLTWQKEKTNILKWIEEPLKVDTKKLLKADYKLSYKLFKFLPLFKIEKNFLNTKIKIFGLLFLVIQNDLRG